MPDESEEEHEDESDQECDETSFVIHDCFYLDSSGLVDGKLGLPGFLQSGDVAVPNECRSRFSIVRFSVSLHFEIENAHAVAGFPLINTSIACADHYAVTSFLFAAEINHCMRNRRIALDRIGPCPEKQIARLQVFQFKSVVLLT